jgi:hypothetical protein
MFFGLYYLVRCVQSLFRPPAGPGHRLPIQPIGAALIMALLGGGHSATHGQQLPVRGQAAADETTSEVRPPDLLELVQVEGAPGRGPVALEAVVKPAMDATVELEVTEPAGLRFGTGRQVEVIELKRRGKQHRRRLHLDLGNGRTETVRLRLHVLNDEGKRWLSLDREIRFNQPHPEPSTDRVPVVQTLPGGRRIVEYMSREDTVRRGLPMKEPLKSTSPGTVPVEGAPSSGQDENDPSPSIPVHE